MARSKNNSLVLGAAGLYPLLEQVLVVAVSAGPERHDRVLPEPARVGVDEDGHEPVELVEPVHVLRDVGRGLLELGLPAAARQVAKLQLQGRDLAGAAVGAPLGRVGTPGAQVHVRERDA